MFYKVLFSLLACLALAKSAPQKVFVGPDGNVGASFGGYHASAGLGGLLSGGPAGGLHAQAGTPLGHFASAGLAGSVGQGGAQGIKYAGAVKPGVTYVAQPAPQPQEVHVVQPQPVYVQQPAPVYVQPQPVVTTVHKAPNFNDIFNIPISTLQAVNQYLNNRPPKVALFSVGPAYVAGRSNTESKAETEAQSSSSSVSSASSSSSSSASSSSSSSSANSAAETEVPAKDVPASAAPAGAVPANAVPGVLVSKTYRTKYDDIFNIPISVLRSVNSLLNG